MPEVQTPTIHNPSKLLADKIADDQKRRQVFLRPPTAPSDKMKDLHREPEWLIPELRSWGALPVEAREERIRNLIAASELSVYKKEVKEKCLRFILTQETERHLLILIVNFIAPKKD